MQVTLRILGVELIYLDLTTDPPEADPDEHAMPSGGATGSTAVGYFAALEVPDMVGLPSRDNGYGDGE